MEPEELYKKLEELREIKKEGNLRNLNYHAIINSIPSSICFGDLVKYHNYVQGIAEKKTEKAGRGY